MDYLRNIRLCIVQVADQNCLRRTNNHTGGFQPYVDSMSAEVALLCGVVFRIDEDGIVRTGSHARFTANTDRFIEVDDTVRSLKHGGRRTGRHTWRVSTLVATGYLMGPSGLGKDADINMLNVGARD
jgi:hypothetical protein